LTGDVGRGCGDASRALLFAPDIIEEFSLGRFLAHTLAHTPLAAP
jgi:hypothetical protein